ncbi:MAG: hypothetical protein M1817_002744 [Caeruleum heppii]|nr:MAG: hypothetical protein M1817_002744 [Caeruleum heppii]
MAMSATYKPSPLSFGSPRSSPFRRPESPGSPSTVRATTPTPSPTKNRTPLHSPSKSLGAETWSARPSSPLAEPPASPSPRRGHSSHQSLGSTTLHGGLDPANAMSKLNPAQLRELREAFQILDRDSDGQVGREDVVDMLKTLGQDSSPPTVSTFFPPGVAQTISMPQFLTQLSTLLAPISPAEELMSAFSAFDEDDSGQIDLGDLRDALLNTAPEAGEGRLLTEGEVDRILAQFQSRKTFGKKGGARGEVFRYQDFVAAVRGNQGKGSAGGKEDE